jgi:cell wall-associated NlpC family hydrolase
MMPTWVQHYLNLPFVEKGRDRTGLDCYGLVRLVYQEQRQIDLPSYTERYATTNDRAEIQAIARQELHARWQPIPLEEARLFDALILRIGGDPIHFGLVLDDQYFLHTMRGIWSVAERWTSLAWSQRVIGAVRYVES